MFLPIVRHALKLRTKTLPLFSVYVRRSHWMKDYVPGAFPKTHEERMAAAKKYGILPEEYNTHPDDGLGIGDYPKLPDVSGDARDPYYPWDNPELKRNFMEPMHANWDAISEDRYDISYRHRKPLWIYFAQFVGVISTQFFIYLQLEKAKSFIGVMPNQYPHQGEVHYTFSLKDGTEDDDIDEDVS